jgi:hypothetical protein
MDKPEFDEFEEAIQKLADEFDAKVASYMKSSGLPETQAIAGLRALGGLRATKERIRELRSAANIPQGSAFDVLTEGMSLGQAFLAWSEESIDEAIGAAQQAEFLPALEAAVRVVRELEQAVDFLAMQDRQDKAIRAANVRHLVDQRRKADAKDLFLSRGWRFKADAARAIESTFHVTYKTAERWIGEWTKQSPPST